MPDFQWPALLGQALTPLDLYSTSWAILVKLVEYHRDGDLTSAELHDQVDQVKKLVEIRYDEMHQLQVVATERWLARRVEAREAPDPAAATAIYVSDENAPDQPNQE